MKYRLKQRKVGNMVNNGLKIAFLCNNYFHLMISRSIIEKVKGEFDLFLFGRIKELGQSELAHDPVWSHVSTWYSDSSVIEILG